MAPALLGPGPGLYDPRNEHDACGVGFVADLSGERRHETVASALTVLRNLEHRGAKGADPQSGDGAGIITQMPDELLRDECNFDLPAVGSYVAGLAFLPANLSRTEVQAAVKRLAADGGLTVRGCRDVADDSQCCGNGAAQVPPELVQLGGSGLAGESRPEAHRK